MDLVSRVAQRLHLSQEQAEGCVGAVLWLAECRLADEDLPQVADSIPGFSDLVGKSPRFDPQHYGLGGWLNRLMGGAGGIGALSSPLAKLGLPRSVAASTVAIVVQYVGQQSGPQAEAILSRTLS
jgi:hypothetical protein